MTIWNYTPEVQYKGLWDDITLMCRGLVTDDTGRIWARPFKKFFNLEEEKHEPTDDFEVFEKLDGSLIIVFWYNGGMVVASRGSFTSDHAIEAGRILQTQHGKFISLFYETPLEDYTFCFELIGFEQIVVAYPEPKLVLTGIFEHRYYDDLWDYFKDHFCDDAIEYLEPYLNIVKKFEGLDWKNIKNLNWKNSEGFVVRFSNGSRCKIKFGDYIRLHRVMTNISEKKIWEALKDGTPISSILENVSDEFFEEVKKIEDDLLRKFYDEGDAYREIFRSILLELGIDATRKAFASKAVLYNHPSILFSMYDGKDYSKQIWKILEP